jgi:hypothetical protein
MSILAISFASFTTSSSLGVVRGVEGIEFVVS